MQITISGTATDDDLAEAIGDGAAVSRAEHITGDPDVWIIVVKAVTALVGVFKVLQAKHFQTKSIIITMSDGRSVEMRFKGMKPEEIERYIKFISENG